MKYYFYFVFSAFFVIAHVHTSSPMELYNSPEILVKQKFAGQELTALALIARSNAKKDSLSLIAQKKIIAVFNYEKQKVITYLDEENHSEFSYARFSEIMLGTWQPGSYDDEIKLIEKAYADSCVCSIS